MCLPRFRGDRRKSGICCRGGSWERVLRIQTWLVVMWRVRAGVRGCGLLCCCKGKVYMLCDVVGLLCCLQFLGDAGLCATVR